MAQLEIWLSASFSSQRDRVWLVTWKLIVSLMSRKSQEKTPNSAGPPKSLS